MPDSTIQLKSRWQSPFSINARVSVYSYRIFIDNGSLRTLHANHLRNFVNHVDAIGVSLDEDTDLGKTEYFLITTPGDEQVINKYSTLDLNHLSVIQQKQTMFLVISWVYVKSPNIRYD